jgi:hypothetical protein
VKVSQSGTGLGFWRNPGEGGHDTLMARIDLTRDWLNASLAANDIPSWQYGGFIWMQGENEANSIVSVAEAYESDFADLAQKVRTRTGVADLPVVLGRISIRLDPNAAYPGPVQQPQLDLVRAGQVSWAENDSNGGWVDTDDLPLIDSWHFGSAGQIRLGRRFAGAWFDLVESRPALRLRRGRSGVHCADLALARLGQLETVWEQRMRGRFASQRREGLTARRAHPPADVRDLDPAWFGLPAVLPMRQRHDDTALTDLTAQAAANPAADTLAQVVTLYNQMGTHFNAGVTARTAGDNATAREHQGKAVDVLQQIDKLLEVPLLWQEEAEMEGWAQPAEYVQMAKEYGKVMGLAKKVRMSGGK